MERVVSDHSHQDGLARVDRYPGGARARRLLAEALGRPRRETAIDDGPRRREGTDELGGGSRMREVVLSTETDGSRNGVVSAPGSLNT